MKDEYLISLVGRNVQVYKGGPDSNVGVLLDVNEDYLTLQKEDGDIIYYKTSHVKSIRENSLIRYNSTLKVYDTNNLVIAATFNELAAHFKDQTVRINGKGPESKVGTLVDVKGDYFVLYTEKDGLIFYKEQHITSLSHSQIITTTNQAVVKDQELPVEVAPPVAETVEDVDPSTTSEELVEEVEEVNEALRIYEQLAADTTSEVLTNLKYSWIKINRKGPESMEGLLVESNDDYLVLAINKEIFRIATYHVKNFSLSINKPEEQTEEKPEEQETEKQIDEKSTHVEQETEQKIDEKKSNEEKLADTSTDEKESNNNQESNEQQKQESPNQEMWTRPRLTYEEELNLANKRRNNRLKKKAQEKRKAALFQARSTAQKKNWK